MHEVCYEGWPAAIVDRASLELAAHIEVLELEHPLRRFVSAMALFALEIDAGQLPGPYSDAIAKLYARCILIPDDEFIDYLLCPEHRVAELFNVPLEQIRLKRLDIAAELVGHQA